MAEDNPAPPPAPAAAPPPTVVPAVPREPETFSKEYVAELRGENNGWRLKAAEQEQRAKAAAEEAKKAREEADAAVAAARAEAEAAKASAQAAADSRVILAELRTAALKAGMVDLDGLKLADLSTVKLSDAGEVEGAEALMEALKAAKPYLFGTARTGAANPADPPKPKPSAPKRASELSDDEYQAALKRIHSGQGLPH